jgi:transposase
VPVLAKGKTRTGRLWTYVRDDRPFGGRDRPAAVFFYSPDRSGKHPEQPSGKLHRVDAGGRPRGVRPALSPGSQAGPIIEAACWAHARRYFFEVARLDKTPIAIEAVKRIDALFAIEREINGIAQQERLRVRSEQSRPLVLALDIWLREQRAKLSGQSKVAKAIAYSLTRWPALTRFLDDGRLCMSTAGLLASYIVWARASHSAVHPTANQYLTIFWRKWRNVSMACRSFIERVRKLFHIW